MTAALAVPAHQPASARLRRLAERVAGGADQRVSVGELVDALGDTGLGLTLLLLMLPVYVAIPGLPVGIVFGALVALLGIQLLRGAVREADASRTAQAIRSAARTLSEVVPPRDHAVLREYVEVIAVAVAVAMAIRTFFLQPFKSPTGSMQPTLFGEHAGSRVPDGHGMVDLVVL